MALPILIFLAVAFAIVGGYYALTTLIFRDATTIRERVDSEFRKSASGPAARSLLFKDLDQIDVIQVPEADAASKDTRLAPVAAAAAGPAPRAPRVAVGLETMLRQASLPISVRQLLTVSLAIGFGLGLAMPHTDRSEEHTSELQ